MKNGPALILNYMYLVQCCCFECLLNDLHEFRPDFLLVDLWGCFFFRFRVGGRKKEKKL